MSNETTTTDIVAGSQVSTPEVYKGKFVVVLSKIGQTVQWFHNAEAKLVYNEDGLAAITEFIEKGKKALKVVEDERVALNEPVLKQQRDINAGAKLISADLQALVDKANREKQKIAAKLAADALIAKEAEEKKAATKKLIDDAIMDYTTKISAAETIDELLDVERRLNLETANEKRYGDQLPDLKTRSEAIRKLLAAQKLSVRQLGSLENEVAKASETGADDKVLEAMDKIEAVKEQIGQNKINVVEAGVSQATQATGYAEPIRTAAPKPSRRSWKYEATDLPLLLKKNPELVNLVLNDAAVKELMKKQLADGTLKEGTTNGLRFYFEIKY